MIGLIFLEERKSFHLSLHVSWQRVGHWGNHEAPPILTDTVGFPFYRCLCDLGFESCDGSSLPFKDSVIWGWGLWWGQQKSLCFQLSLWSSLSFNLHMKEIGPTMTRALTPKWQRFLEGRSTAITGLKAKAPSAVTVFWFELIITDCFHWWDKDRQCGLLRIEYSELHWGWSLTSSWTICHDPALIILFFFPL